MANVNLIFQVSEPRKLQLSGIQNKYRKILSDIISMEVSELNIIPLANFYKIGITEVNHHYSENDIKDLEKVRTFQMLCQQTIGGPESEVGLISPECKIMLYSRVLPFSNAEMSRVEKINMTLELTFKKCEIGVENEPTLQLSLVDRRHDYLLFELPQKFFEPKKTER